MSKLGKELVQAAREGIAIARGELDPATYRVHVPDDGTPGMRSKSKPGMFRPVAKKVSPKYHAAGGRKSRKKSSRATRG